MTVSTARQQLTSQGASQGLSFTGWQLLPTVPKCLPTSEPAMSVSLPTYPYIHNVQRPKVNIRRHILLLQTSSILNVRVGRDLRNSSSVFYNLSSRKKKKVVESFCSKIGFYGNLMLTSDKLWPGTMEQSLYLTKVSKHDPQASHRNRSRQFQANQRLEGRGLTRLTQPVYRSTS